MPLVKRLVQHKLVLDTHVWIWIMEGSNNLSKTFKFAIDRIQKQENIFISPISVWEIGMLVEKKRVGLDMDVLDWVEQSLNFPGIHLSPITPAIAIQSTRLPGVIHGDPADRILIATAHIENAVLVTCDTKLLDYGKDKFVNVYNPC